MSYHGLGAPLTNSGIFIGGGAIANTSVDPNAWRETVRTNALNLANALAVATKGDRVWSSTITKLLTLSGNARTGTPEQLLAMVPAQPFYTGGWKSTWAGDSFSQATNGTAALKTLISSKIGSTSTPNISSSIQFFGSGAPLIGSGVSTTPPPPPPPPVTVAAMDPATVRGTPEYIAACTRAGAMIDPSTGECVPMTPSPMTIAPCGPGLIRIPGVPDCQPDPSYVPDVIVPSIVPNPYANPDEEEIARLRATNPGLGYATLQRLAAEIRRLMGTGMSRDEAVRLTLATVPSAGPLGLSWKTWGIGAVVLVGGYAASRALKANRRRVRRNRRRR